MSFKQRMIVTGVLFVMGIIYVVSFIVKNNNQVKLQLQARKEVICPSFLSIGRSARDTLIVMRNEPLCNQYVLENLQ
jgi:hypothetical protein